MHHPKLLVLAGLAALLFPSAAWTQTFVPAPLPAELKKAGMPASARFGYVAVPENRVSPNGRSLHLAVAILPASGSPKHADPIFFLTGGPGGTATLTATVETFPVLAEHRDVVFVDQRGCGFSRPFLGVASDDSTAPFPPILRARERFRAAGIPLEVYNTRENAADIEAVRVALGYGRINLLGSSYGTILAQQMMSDFPATLRSVVLSGTVPLRGWDFVPGNQLVQRDGLRALFRDVRRTPPARRAFPALASRYEEALARLLAKPVMVRKNGRLVRLDAFVFQSSLLGLLQVPQTIKYVPLFIETVWEKRYADAAPLLSVKAPVRERNFAFGMYLSVVAHDLFPPGSRKSALAQVAALPAGPFKAMTRYTVSRLTRAIGAWPVPYDRMAIRPPFGSPIPTLLVEGVMDAQTPPTGGADATRVLGLKNAFVLTFPRSGHGTGATAGPAFDAIRQFYARPDRRPAVSLAPLRGRHFYLTTFPSAARARALKAPAPVAPR